jgi:hypothetical protein
MAVKSFIVQTPGLLVALPTSIRLY